MAIVDVNRDGRRDVVCAHGSYETLTVTHQTQAGVLGEWESYPIPYCNWYNYGALASGDFNSDGQPDIAIADWWNGLVVLNHAGRADTTAPICLACISGTPGNNGWYVSPVSVSLGAEDEGDIAVCYTTDGNAWTTYSTPISLYSDGQYQVGYYAEDSAGNQSEVQWLTIAIDTTAPVMTLTPATTEVWPPTGEIVQVAVTISSRDNLSGVEYMHLSVVDEYGEIFNEFDVSDGTLDIPVIASRSDDDTNGRVYTLVLSCADAAGNQAEARSTITVPHHNPRSPGKPGKQNRKLK